MKLISWNVWDINGPTKHKMIHIKILEEKHSVIMIQETKCSNNTLETLMAHLWKGSKVASIDAVGASGGLKIIWNPFEVTLNDFLATKNTLSTSFHLSGTNIHEFLWPSNPRPKNQNAWILGLVQANPPMAALDPREVSLT
jgi:hypothetical protein